MSGKTKKNEKHPKMPTAIKGQLWTKREDAILLRHIKRNPHSYRSKEVVAKIQRDLQNTRTLLGIIARLRKIRDAIHRDKCRSNENANGEKSDSEVDSDTSDLNRDPPPNCSKQSKTSMIHPIIPITNCKQPQKVKTQSVNKLNHQKPTQCPPVVMVEDSVMKQRAITIFEKLKRYYAADNNQFDLRNIENTLSALRECDGQNEKILEITLNPLQYFEDKVVALEAKHGAIDFEEESRIISTLESNRESYRIAIQQIDAALKTVNAQMRFGTESELRTLTGCDLDYWRNIIFAINAPKCPSSERKHSAEIVIISDSDDTAVPESAVQNSNVDLGDSDNYEIRSKKRRRSDSRSCSRSRSRSGGRANTKRMRSDNPFFSDSCSASPSFSSLSSTVPQLTQLNGQNAGRALVESVFEVEHILDRRDVDGKRQYLVKWKGFDGKENTWEPIDNIKHCIEQVRDYDVNVTAENDSSDDEDLIDITGMPQLEAQPESETVDSTMKMEKCVSDVIIISDSDSGPGLLENDNSLHKDCTHSSASDMDLGNGTDSD